MSLLDVRIEPLRSKMTCNWDSSEEELKTPKEEETLQVPKVTTIKEFYDKRKSRLDPFNSFLSQK